MEGAKFENHTLGDRVYQRIRTLISSGELLAGTQLDERRLADELGISRTPLREAIGKLAQEGIVEHRSYRGNFVRTFSAKQVNDLYEVRGALEALAIRTAVPLLTDDDVEHLSAILEEISVAVEADDMVALSDADQRFHRAISQFSGNATLVESLERLGFQIQVVRNVANRDPDVVERTLRERPKILDALVRRDAKLAARLMEEHIDGVRRAVVGQLRDMEEAG